MHSSHTIKANYYETSTSQKTIHNEVQCPPNGMRDHNWNNLCQPIKARFVNKNNITEHVPQTYNFKGATIKANKRKRAKNPINFPAPKVLWQKN